MTKSPVALLIKARVRRQLLVDELAWLAGIPADTIRQIEAGEVVPDPETLNLLIASTGYRIKNRDITNHPAREKLLEYMARVGGREIKKRDLMLIRAVAAVTPIQFREGMRTYNTSISEAFNWLEENTPDGKGYAISGLEAVNGATSRRPIVYIDPDVELPWESYPNIRGTIITLPYTERERRFTEIENGARFMTERWALIDALAAPGRQSDSALRYLSFKYGRYGL